MRRLKKLLWLGFIISLIPSSVACHFLDKWYESTSTTLVAWPRAFRFKNLGFDGLRPYTPEITLDIKNFDRMQKKVLIKVRCLDHTTPGAALVSHGTCDGVYVQQSQAIDSIATGLPIRLDDQREMDWHVSVEAEQFWFPFDRLTIIGQVAKTEVFYVAGQIQDFQRIVLAHWNTLDIETPRANLYATIAIRFSRSWCLWLLALNFFGVGALVGIGASCLSGGSRIEAIAILGFLIALITLRPAILNQASAPTILDLVLGATFVICAVILFFLSPRHPRIRPT